MSLHNSNVKNLNQIYFQLQDAKDLHHLSLVGSYGAHLLHGFPPHFLHPAVSSANTSGGPFSGGGAFVKPFPSSLPLPSAFAPPKCVGGLEQVNMTFMSNIRDNWIIKFSFSFLFFF